MLLLRSVLLRKLVSKSYFDGAIQTVLSFDLLKDCFPKIQKSPYHSDAIQANSYGSRSLSQNFKLRDSLINSGLLNSTRTKKLVTRILDTTLSPFVASVGKFSIQFRTSPPHGL